MTTVSTGNKKARAEALVKATAQGGDTAAGDIGEARISSGLLIIERCNCLEFGIARLLIWAYVCIAQIGPIHIRSQIFTADNAIGCPLNSRTFLGGNAAQPPITNGLGT